ncbi:F-box domain, cyclin-like protein [Tanacetum coccineum]
MVTASGNSLVELHLEHVDVSGITLLALSKCSSLQVLHLEGLRNCTTVLICAAENCVEAFALGCPNLVEIRLTKCENVTREVKDRLRARKRSLVVKLDALKSKTVNAIMGDNGVQEHVAEVPLKADHVAVTEP